MQNLRNLCILALILFSVKVHGQSTAPNSREPGTKLQVYSPRHQKASKFRKAKVTNTARYEFYDRVEKAAREKKKILKKLSKPQYSDRRYFGHKHIPKRNPAYKMEYCNECGIRH
jgi:hypothetical protein